MSDEDPRPHPPLAANELDTVLGFLDFQRATFAWRCSDLTDTQLRSTLHPTTMTLAGMLKHLAYVEDYWFAEVIADGPAIEPWAGVDWSTDGDWDWHSAATDPGEELRALWSGAVDRSRAVVEGALQTTGLDGTHAAWGGKGQVSLRWVVVHMIEEYARHNGHADLLREALDGTTGE